MGILFTADSYEIVANARDSIAWRYALRELNPFVITDADYARHNTDGSLDLYDEATGTGTMTDRYLADRAAMLAWRIRYEVAGARDDNYGQRDGPKPYNEDWDTNTVQGNWDFVDLGTRLPGGQPLTLAIDGAGLSLSDHQVVFGTTANDTINGESESDSLYGMAGDDTLNGKEGSDYLEGHGGADTLTGGDGADTLLDAFGNDRLDGGDSNGQRDIIDRLGNLFFGATSTITTSLRADLNGAQFTIDATLSRDEIVAQARDSIAWRHALCKLNSIVIIGASVGGSAGSAANYQAWSRAA